MIDDVAETDEMGWDGMLSCFLVIALLITHSMTP